MRKLKRYARENPHAAVGFPAWLCFISFIVNLVYFAKDGFLDKFEMQQLLITADGFETVVLFIIMLVLRKKKN
ncbi:MAG TPA: hypothetical protein ACFYDZ_00170 [Candidatus Brocadiaceae bacterium]